jgi:hypothetical protein
MEWYWYFTGAITTAGSLSVILNFLLLTDSIKITVNKPVVRRIYDQDNSGSYKRAM